MRQAFQYAKQNHSKAIMILIQANPRFEETWPARGRGALGIAPPPKKPGG